MNYIAEIKAFQGLAQDKRLSAGQIALWYALMYVNNKCNWDEWFTVANLSLEINTGLTQKAIYNARNVLKQYGLVDIRANGTKATAYRMVSLVENGHETTKNNSEPTKSATIVTTTDTTTGTTTDTTTLNKQDKTIQNKDKNTDVFLHGADKPPPCHSSAAPFITLMLNDKSEYQVSDDQVQSWQELYPAADVRQELRSMKGWLNSNPTKRKTRGGIERFITAWLSKSQNEGGKNRNHPAYPEKKNKYAERTFGIVLE